jgi:CheY-like chemotaxis protein
MKESLKLLAMAGVLCAGLFTIHAADQQVPAGPKGGRLLEKTEPKAEFYLEKDHTATVTFYDTALKPVAATGQTVTVIASGKESKVTVEFEKKGDVLVSKTKLPEGDGYNLVVQLKQTADAKPQNFRFKLETHECAECKRAEYACICGH